MSNERTFTNVDDTILVHHIQTATQKVVFVAPGIRKKVAEALAELYDREPKLSITAILDVDAEICRLGYGDLDGLATLKTVTEKNGGLLLHQPGIRIGLLIVDDITLVYSPTPLLIEAGSEQETKPNAIRIKTPDIPALEAACSEVEGHHGPEIGLDPAKTPDIEIVKKDLEKNPPQKFDVSRAVRVFNSRVQYVEFKFEGYKLSLKEVVVPPNMLGLGEDPQMAARWHNTFRPFQQPEYFTFRYEWTDEHGSIRMERITEGTLGRDRFAIKKTFLKDIKDHGTIILRTHVPAFNQAIEHLKKKTEAFKEFVGREIGKVIEESATNLVADLWPKIKDQGMNLNGWANATPQKKRAILTEHIMSILSVAISDYDPKIDCRYKDVAYESIQDKDFMIAINSAFAGEEKALFGEFDAAPSTGEQLNLMTE